MPSALMFGSYLGFLLMNVIDKGVTEMQVVEPAQVFTRKVRDVLLDNYSKEKAAQLLQTIRLAIKDPLQLTTVDVPQKYDILMLGISSNHDLFSSQVLEQVTKAKLDFLRPAHRIMPCRVQVFGRLVAWDESEVSFGVNLDPIAKYRWSLIPDPIDLSYQNFSLLSGDILLADINLQEAGLVKPFDEKLTVDIIKSGRVQGVITWLVVDIAEGVTVSNSPFIDPEERSTFRKPLYQYLDPRAVEAGGFLDLTVHFNLSKVWCETTPRSSMIRSHMIPSWYFEMLHDEERNAKYKEAVQWLIRDWVKKNPHAKQCNVVDVGSGLGLLSVYAAQASEKARVYAVESSPHLSQSAVEVFKENHVAPQIKSVKKDARHLTAKEITNPADILLFEVFDAGLLGEGIIHFIEVERVFFFFFFFFFSLFFLLASS
jgi:hypothetical protein